MTTPRTASNSDARKRLAEQAADGTITDQSGTALLARQTGQGGADGVPRRTAQTTDLTVPADPTPTRAPHWDPAVVQLIEQARAEGATVESLALDAANERAERWKARCDEARATIARIEALGLRCEWGCDDELRAALRGDA